MKTTFHEKIVVHTDRNSVWEFFWNPRCSRQYFPEIKKKPRGRSYYVQISHKKVDKLLPSHTVPDQAITWGTVTGITFNIPFLKYLNAKVESVEMEISEGEQDILITFSVETKISNGYLFGLVALLIKLFYQRKLLVIKSALENNEKCNYLDKKLTA